MRFTSRTGVAAALVLVGVAVGVVYGFAPRPKTNVPQAAAESKLGTDKADVHKAPEAFVNAFNENDAAKMSATMTPTAEYIDDDSNRVADAKAIGTCSPGFSRPTRARGSS